MFFPRLGVLRKVKKVLGFPKMFSFDPDRSYTAIIKQYRKNISLKYGAILPRQVIPFKTYKLM